jgi:site-specific recombinase XerD
MAPEPKTHASKYQAQKITVELIRKVAGWPAPESPREILDSASGLILRHQPSGFIGLYVALGRGKRERPFGKKCDARKISGVGAQSSPLTLGAVKAEAKRLRGEDASGRDFKGERAGERAIPTLNDYLEDSYGPWVLQNRRSGKATLARIKSCFADDFGDEKLSAITAARVEKWASGRQRDGATPETINRDVSALRAALKRAVKPLKLMRENPLAECESLEIDKNKRVRRALAAPEIEKLRAALAARDEKKAAERASANEWRRARNVEELPSLAGLYADALSPAVLVSLETGLRRNELFALEWPNVDFAEKIVRVEGKTAKSFQTREIPMSADALSVLRRWWLQLGQPKAGPVFSVDGERLGSLKKSFAAVLKEASIKNTKAGRVSWHSLRHSFGSRLGAAGVDAATLRDLLGHADLKVTNRYIHSDAERKRAAVDLLKAAQ